MNVISFRIPYFLFGRVNYINGAALSKKSYEKGEMILVEDLGGNTSLSCVPAEVIDTRLAGRSDYGFKIIQ